MVYDNQKIRFGYKQYASSELFNNFSEEVWEDFQKSNSDFFSDGILNEQQFLISVASIGSPSYINVGNGVGYSSGNRIYIGSSDTVTYDEHRPLHPQFPQSTGRINIPIPTRDVIHYVWIRHIWTVDPNTSGINRSGSVIYYRWENGYEIKVSTSVTPPGTGYLLIGNVIIRSDNSYSIGYAGRRYINLNINIYSIDYKSSCFAATTSDINATYDYNTQTFIANSFGVLTIDGVEPSIGQRVLVKNQSTDPEHNGIYVVVDAGSASSKWILQRAADANSSQLITNGMYTFIGSGTTNNNSGWILISPDPITLDTTPLYFDQYGLTSVIGTGNPSELTYWTDTNKINGINTIQWDTGSKILHVSDSTLLLESGSFGKYDLHPVFTQATQIVDKQYVDEVVASATQIPGGINKSVQFNDNGTFGGDANLLYDSSILTLTAPIVSVTQGISVTGSLGPGTSAIDIIGGSAPGNRALTAIGNSNTYTAVFSSSTHSNVVVIRDESTPIDAGHCALRVTSSEATGCGIFGKRGLLVSAYGDGVNDYGININGNRHYIDGGPLHLEFAAKYRHHPIFIEDEELVDKKYVDDIVASATQIPGGSDTSIQFNDGGVFGGDSNFTYKKLPGILSIGTSAPNDGVINIGYRTSFDSGLSINVGSGNRTAADFTNNASSYVYPTIRVKNLNANGLSALFDGILETNKFRLTTGPVVGSILYASNLYGDASWTTNLLWNQSTNTLHIPSLVVTNGIQIISAGYGTGPWQLPTTDFSTFESWANGIPAIVTGCPPDGLTQLAIKVDGVIKIFQTIDII